MSIRRDARFGAVLFGALLVGGCVSEGRGVLEVLDRPGIVYCAQQSQEGPVTIGLSVVKNAGDRAVALSGFELVNPTPGVTLAGVHLEGVDSSVANGQPYHAPTRPQLVIEPGAEMLVVYGIGLDAGVHAGRTDGLRFSYAAPDGSMSHGETLIVVQTSEPGAPCDMAWVPGTGS